MEEKTNVKVINKGMGLGTILTIIFVIAKIIGLVNWSWWLVFLPAIIAIGFSLLFYLIVLIVIIIIAIKER